MTDEEFFEATFEAGSIAWETGAGMLPMPDDEEDGTFLGVWWMGYMIARARDYFRRRDLALYPDTVEFRP